MARDEQDREDLMREAVALRERIELRIFGFDPLVTIGFRDNTAMSLFIGQDPVYQFDSLGRLRRAFVGGLLYRSQHTTLAMLRRVRTETQTILERTDLDADRLALFRASMMQDLRQLELALQNADYEVIRSVPETDSHIDRILTAQKTISQADPWLSPVIRRRI